MNINQQSAAQFIHGLYGELEQAEYVSGPMRRSRSSSFTPVKEEIQAGSDEAEQRRVVCAANIFPDGTLFIGVRHWDFLMDSQLKTKSVTWKRLYLHKDQQGFIDQHGKFMSREEALAVAMATGQRIYRCGGDLNKLYSENLY